MIEMGGSSSQDVLGNAFDLIKNRGKSLTVMVMSL